MKIVIAILLSIFLFMSCASEPQLESGLDVSGFDKSIRPQDDLYRYVNGKWLGETEIPEDKSNYGSFTVLQDLSEKRLREIIEASAAADHPKGSAAQKVGDFFASYMDSVAAEKLGIKPIEYELAVIEGLQSRSDLAKYFAHARKVGVSAPFGFYINLDSKNTDEYITWLTQSGLSMPDRSYYLEDTDRFKEIREKYIACIEKLFTLAGSEDAVAKAARVLEIETSIAEKHWTRVENRNRNKTYNKYEIAKLDELVPGFDWNMFLTESGIENEKETIKT